MALLNVKDVSLGYGGSKVIDSLSFSVAEGDYLCIVGENGSGKSTLMKALLGLISSMSGEIIFEGFKRNEVGYLPQQTELQMDFPASVGEVVLSGCLNRQGLRPYYNAQEKKLAYDNLERLGISGLAKRCYRELSGGQKQRVLLARALCATEKILLLDEPVAGLDPKATLEMYQIIEELNNSGITIVMISHDIVSATKYSSHILHLGNGTSFFGAKKEYLSSEIGKRYNMASGGDKK